MQGCPTATASLKELTLAQHETPGLLACRADFGPQQPFQGMNINGYLHITIQTGVLIETISSLGAKVRPCWCSCNIFSTHGRAAAAIAEAGASIVLHGRARRFQSTLGAQSRH